MKPVDVTALCGLQELASLEKQVTALEKWSGVTEEWREGYKRCQKEILTLVRKANVSAQENYKLAITETLKNLKPDKEAVQATNFNAVLVQPLLKNTEIRANDGTRTREWWNHNPLP